mmetsp:Transcript_72850/g.202024  ORF Transcript_72850/g.202024 Transcript_72850/m.202024 type:complete len:275 (+) Transcript_72850:1007-1831(+)
MRYGIMKSARSSRSSSSSLSASLPPVLAWRLRIFPFSFSTLAEKAAMRPCSRSMIPFASSSFLRCSSSSACRQLFFSRSCFKCAWPSATSRPNEMAWASAFDAASIAAACSAVRATSLRRASWPFCTEASSARSLARLTACNCAVCARKYCSSARTPCATASNPFATSSRRTNASSNVSGGACFSASSPTAIGLNGVAMKLTWFFRLQIGLTLGVVVVLLVGVKQSSASLSFDTDLFKRDVLSSSNLAAPLDKAVTSSCCRSSWYCRSSRSARC